MPRQHYVDVGKNSNRRSFLKAAGGAAAVGTFGLTGCLGGGGGGDEVIRLGTAFPFTGPYSDDAAAQRAGVELAVQEINDQGGLLDQDVEVIERDTELDGETSARRINDLIENENIDLLVANLSGGISIQTNSQAHDAEVPYMAACQTVMDFHKTGFLGTGCFTPYALNYQSMYAGAQYIYDNLGQSMYGVPADYAWGNKSWYHMSTAFEELGGTIEGVSRAPLGATDFSSHLNAAQNSSAEVLYFHNLGSDTANAIQQTREFGIHEEMKIYIGVTTTTTAQRAGQDQWDGIHAGIYYTPRADNPQTREFSEKMQDEYGNPGDSYSAVSYTGSKELARAVEIAGSTEYNAVADALIDNPDFAHVKTDERWRDCDNQSIQDWYIIRGKPVSEQENEWDIWEPVGSVGGEDILPECSEYENPP